MRRLATALVALTLLAGLAASAAAVTRGIVLAEASGARFPDRKFVLTLPTDRPLTAEQVRVHENGNDVSRLSVVPAGAAKEGEFGVALVIDASNSMRGSAINEAFAAARVFAEQRNGNQQLAVIAFNRRTSVLLPFTTDEGAIEDALATPPPLAEGTHVYDGVARALRLLKDAKIAAGSIIVLSDGADTGSRATSLEVATAARGARVRLISIGIRSESFEPIPLQRLAARAGGEYSGVTSPSELSRIYGALGARFSRQYLVQYRSFAGPKKRIRVVLTIDGGRESARTGYMTPALAVTEAPVFRHSLWDRFWASTLTMVLVGFASALLVVLAIVALIRPRRGTLRKRLAQFVSLPMRGGDGKRQGPLSSRVLVGAERSLEGTRFWARFKEYLELAEIHIPPAQIAVATAVLTLLVMLVFYMVFPPLALVGLGVPFGVRAVILKKVSHRRKAFAEQLPDNLQVLSSALRAGHSFVGALSVVVDDASEPARGEFRRVVADEQLGVPLEDAIDAVRRRMDNRDLEQVSLVAAMQRQTGGNMAEVLDRVTETIRERFELRRMVKTLTAQGRLSRWIVSAIPIVLLVAISVLNPQYMQPLFVEPMGRVLLVLAAVFVALGSYVIGRIVDIEV